MKKLLMTSVLMLALSAVSFGFVMGNLDNYIYFMDAPSSLSATFDALGATWGTENLRFTAGLTDVRYIFFNGNDRVKEVTSICSKRRGRFCLQGAFIFCFSWLQV